MNWVNVLVGVTKGEITLKREGDRKICSECQVNGINIEIVCKKITFKGDERLSWRNPDGSPHFDFVEHLDGTVTYPHTPTVLTPLEVWQSEIEERLASIERSTGIIIE
jgi:hypothetical protein